MPGGSVGVMIAWMREMQASMTAPRRSVQRASLKNWLPQAWLRSTGRRLVFWIGAATPHPSRHRRREEDVGSGASADAPLELSLFFNPGLIVSSRG